MTGNQKTVVRGGFGIAFDRYESGLTGGGTNPPYVLNPSLSFGYLQDITSGGGGALSPLSPSGDAPNSTFASVYSYSIGSSGISARERCSMSPTSARNRAIIRAG